MAHNVRDIRSLARTHTAMALKTLVAIAKQPKAPPAARVSAAQALLDRGWGKAAQPVTGEGGEGPIKIQKIEVEIVDPAEAS
jgi:hypothetical protein